MLFDQPLTAAPVLNLPNWYVAWGGLERQPTAAAASGRRVVISLSAAGEPPIDNVVSFSPPPFDVLSRWLVPAAAFANYPLRLGP